jgi:predicted nucleic acid-binding Zn ribbon protein
VRRAGPRSLGKALGDATARAAPATLLARVQARWPELAGQAISAEATPVAEHGGTLTIECRSAVWAAELELLGPDLLRRLNEALGPVGRPPLTRLRVRATGGR